MLDNLNNLRIMGCDQVIKKNGKYIAVQNTMIWSGACYLNVS